MTEVVTVESTEEETEVKGFRAVLGHRDLVTVISPDSGLDN